MVEMGLFSSLRMLFRPSPSSSHRKPVRVRVCAGEFAGQMGWCREVEQFEAGEFSPGRMIPIDTDGGRHLHLLFEEIEVL